MNAGPIAAWHDLFLGDDPGAELDWLAGRQQTAGIYFGDRPLCTVGRPRFLSASAYSALATTCGILLGAFERLGGAALEDADLRAEFQLTDWEESLLGRMPRSPVCSPLARIDAFIDPDSGIPRLAEFNGETPAGFGYADALSELFAALPTMHRFCRDWDVRALAMRPRLLGVLLATWRRFSGGTTVPHIAIVDWAGVATTSEFILVRDYLHRRGYPCTITTPEALEYRNGKLCDHDGTAIDLVYKRVLLHELVERGGNDHPLLRAVADRNVAMINPIEGKPLHKKASLAVLTDERHRGLFTAPELAAIRQHVPWTRVVEERHTEFADASIDLVPWILDNRDQLVLKPNDDYGGAGIVLGWTVDDAAWHAAVTRALTLPTVVQHRINLPSEGFPSRDDSGAVAISQRIVDIAPFCWDGTFMDGTLTRISTDPLVNVTAGGGSTVPTFIVEPRP